MALRIRIYKNIEDFQKKPIIGLFTIRQACFLAVGLLTYSLFSNKLSVGVSMFSYALKLSLFMPFVLIGFVKIQGFYLEKYIVSFFKLMTRPNTRYYEFKPVYNKKNKKGDT